MTKADALLPGTGLCKSFHSTLQDLVDLKALPEAFAGLLQVIGIQYVGDSDLVAAEVLAFIETLRRSDHDSLPLVLEIPEHEDGEGLGILDGKPCYQIEGAVGT